MWIERTVTIGTTEDEQATGGSAEPGDPAHCNNFSITGPTLECVLSLNQNTTEKHTELGTRA